MPDRIPHRLARSAGAFVAALPLVLSLASPARASADIDCYPEQRLTHASFTRCNLMAVLQPGNDTRANLLLLLLDRDRLPPRSPPPPVPDAVPLLYWQDFQDHYVAPQTQGTSGYARGEGSRCLSNPSGKAAFEAAVTAATDVSADDRAALIDARKDFTPICGETGRAQVTGSPMIVVNHPPGSPTGRAFATYLQGVEAFYASRFDTAETTFAKLHGTSDAWLADTADYMVARSLVNRVQIGTFDDYGERAMSAKVDQAVADRATAALEAYRRDHPNGRYVASALGLERRVDWFADRKDALAASFAAFLARPYAERGIDDGALAEEIADKLLPDLDPTKVHDPILLAAFDLAAMRHPLPPSPYLGDEEGDRSVKPRPVDLVAQRADFAAASAMPLFDLVAAAQAFYVDHDPAKVMKLLPDDTRRRDGDHLWFSRQVLRGLALEARGDRNARGFWKELYAATSRPLDQLTVQLGLALHDERARTLDDVFAPGSVVTSPTMRKTLLQSSADAALLRRQARKADAPAPERQLALATLLWKEVTRGHYADFVADTALIPEVAPADTSDHDWLFGMVQDTDPGDIDCPKLTTTAATLARDPDDTRARLCVAELARLSQGNYDGVNVDPPANSLAEPAKARDLGGASMFPGKPYARSATYEAIIADRSAPPADRAFALYRAVMCWAPSGVNDCGGPDVPKAQREAWYKALKREYPSSRWAKELAYWW